MKKICFLLILALSLLGCKSSRVGETRNVRVRLLDDHVLPGDLQHEGFQFGGLSGIAYEAGTFFLVSDHPGHPRIYTAEISISGERIDSITIDHSIEIPQRDSILKEAHLDLEDIAIEDQGFIVTSEGNVEELKNPMVFSVSRTGQLDQVYQVPENLLATGTERPRNNGTLEGLAESFDQEAYWVAMELPLKADGPKAKLIRTKSPVRITRINKESREPVRQFPYLLEPIAKIPWLYFAVNGVTDLLEYAPDRFLVLERGFASGHGTKGNTIRIFDVDARLATNTLNKKNLRVNFYNPAKKQLLYDFKWAKKYLSQETIDNIEGMTFGPKLENGNRTIILVSDNNFNTLGKQMNQIILLEFQAKR